jgi:hypothetical protein
MSPPVFANGREISGKATNNRSVAAMPDVCLSPPGPPAGPIPIPYPNTSLSSDTDEGSKGVKVGDKEVGLKNQSDYKTSTGNEAATKQFGAGLVSHVITGKTKHVAWSFDVKFEAQNVIRHMDLTTHNHNNPTNGAITFDAGNMFVDAGESPEKDCGQLQEENQTLRSRADASNGPTESQLEEATTLTTAQYHDFASGKRYNMKGFSRQLDKTGWAQGVGTAWFSEVETQKTNITSAPSNIKGFEYKFTANMPHSSHTESRVIEDIFAASDGKPKGKLRMRIQWHRKSKGKMSAEACKHCKRLICAAMKNGLEIELCDDDGNPQKPDWCDDYSE